MKGFSNNLILSNNEITLRAIQKHDLIELKKISGIKEDWKFYTHDLSTIDGLENWAKPAFEKERLQFVVLLNKNEEIIGSTAFGNYSERDKRIEIGWSWLGNPYRGKGYNTQMKKLMLAYSFEVLQLERVEFKTDELNILAIKSLEKIGAVREGILRSHTLMTDQRRRNTLYFSILKAEWPLLNIR
jgi:RimJ/RimL family protein N-acetyltransferase